MTKSITQRTTAKSLWLLILISALAHSSCRKPNTERGKAINGQHMIDAATGDNAASIILNGKLSGSFSSRYIGTLEGNSGASELGCQFNAGGAECRMVSQKYYATGAEFVVRFESCTTYEEEVCGGPLETKFTCFVPASKFVKRLEGSSDATEIQCERIGDSIPRKPW